MLNSLLSHELKYMCTTPEYNNIRNTTIPEVWNLHSEGHAASQTRVSSVSTVVCGSPHCSTLSGKTANHSYLLEQTP